ncbi:hypothetical protein BH10PLA2_BH10PLA2_37180 [soil metagenome]
MVERWFHQSVRGIVATILSQQGANEQAVEPVSLFVLEQHGRMPDYLRLPLLLVTLAFDAYPCLFRGRPLHCLPVSHRGRYVEAWRKGWFGVQRDLVKFYESLTTFGWQAEQHVNDPSN